MANLDRLDAAALRGAVVRFRDLLVERRAGLNGLNVYPVPDGDTGTNMSLTLESVVVELDGVSTDFASVCKAMAHGSLMGARGNSGVILSQIMRGLASVLGEHDDGSAETVAEAFTLAATSAYEAVGNPVEGTILTVVRELAAAQRAAVGAGADLAAMLAAGYEAGHVALARTPELLPVLAEAGVVDAGGAGLLLFHDALLEIVEGRVPTEPPWVGMTATVDASAQSASATESAPSVADLRYEVMFFLDAPDEAVDGFRGAWAAIGDSIVVVGGDGLWNCHVHTNDIGGAIEAGVDVGRPHKIRVTDLFEEVEHVESIEAPIAEGVAMLDATPARTAVVAVAVGDGVRRIFESLGVRAVVAGGQTMNPATEMLLEAVQQVAADQVVILPNNKNIVAVAEQVDGQTDKHVVVLPTTSIAEGFAGLLAYDPEAGADENFASMEVACSVVVAGEVTRAVRDATSPIGPIAEGDHLGLDRTGVRVVTPGLVDAATSLLAELVEPDHEIVTIIEGAGATGSDTDAIRQWLTEHRPRVEIEVHDGGQPNYPYYFGIE